jgi:hypothetical protein
MLNNLMRCAMSATLLEEVVLAFSLHIASRVESRLEAIWTKGISIVD